MTSRKILILLGHPDPSPERLCHGLAEAYAKGAREAGHSVELLSIAEHEIPFIASRADWESDQRPAFVEPAQDALLRADHLVLVHPLWLGTMPAALKAFLEQVLRPDFAFDQSASNPLRAGRMKGKSARIVVTMGMPAFVYRLYYLSHGLSATRRNILKFTGFGPVRTSVIGAAEAEGRRHRQAWLDRMRHFGARAA